MIYFETVSSQKCNLEKSERTTIRTISSSIKDTLFEHSPGGASPAQ